MTKKSAVSDGVRYSSESSDSNQQSEFLRLVQKFLLVSLFTLVSGPPAWAAYGVDSYLSTRSNSEEMPTLANLLGDVRAGWTRQEILYETIGGANGTNYASDDEAADFVRAKGVKILGLLNYNTNPPSASDWEGFVANAVNHFASKIDAWEVINEPNDTALSNRYMSASTYSDYLSRSYGKIKQFDSSATVVSGGTASADVPWLSSLVSAAGCGSFDALGIHPYRDFRPELVKFGEGDFANYLGTVAAVLRKNCSGKKIWLTEFGYSAGIGSETQANYLARSFLMANQIPEVETIMMHLLRDDANNDYGLVTRSFSQRTAFSRVQKVFQETGSRSYSEELLATDRRQVVDFDTTVGWDERGNSNASTTLATVSGVDGSALEARYTFSGSTGAVILTKETPIDGTPTALGLYLSGDNSRHIWRIRFEDANGETFQGVLGNALSGWNYYQLDLTNLSAMTYWGGNGSIQYPIKFTSIVLDKDTSTTSGTIKFDTLVAVTSAADVKALKFGTRVAAWKAQGSGSATICGQSVGLNEAPTYLTVSSSCTTAAPSGATSATSSVTPTATATATPTATATTSSSPSPTKSAAASPTATPSSTPTVGTLDSTKTLVVVDRLTAPADGIEPITLTLQAVDTTGQPLRIDGWEVVGYRPSTIYHPPTNSTVPAILSATEPGLEELDIHLAGGVTLAQKIRLVWTDPAWASNPTLEQLAPELITELRGDDPTLLSGERVITGLINTYRGIKVGLGLDQEPALVIATLESTPRSLILSSLGNATYGGVLPLPGEAGDHHLTITAYDALGLPVAALQAQVRLTDPNQPLVGTSPTSTSFAKSNPSAIVWVFIGLALVSLVFGAYRWWRAHRPKAN